MNRIIIACLLMTVSILIHAQESKQDSVQRSPKKTPQKSLELSPQGSSQVIDKVIAKVGGEYLLYSDLINGYRYQKERMPELEESAQCAIMEQLISQKILIDQAKLDSIEVSPDEVESQLDYRIENILRAMGGDEKRFNDYYGKSVGEVKDDMRLDMKQNILAQRIQGRLINEVTITPKEVVKFYEQIPADSIPFLSSEVEISEIIYKPKVNDEESAKAKDKLIDIRQRIMDEENTFEEMASKYSADGSRETGGDLGWAKRGSYVPAFEAVAYTLEKGEISDVVETEFGFHIIKLKERRGNSINVQHILIRPTITSDDNKLAKEKLDSVRNMILEDSLKFEYAVKLFSDKDSPSYNNGGRMQNPKTGDIYFETADLPPDIYFEIEDIEIGDITEPLESYDARNELQYRIVRLESRTKPHRASLEQDYSRIQRFAKESKKNEYYNNWMVDKMGQTFIEIDTDLSSCQNLTQWIKDAPVAAPTPD